MRARHWLLGLALLANPLHAQVVTDGSAGVSGSVPFDATTSTFAIDESLGARQGQNLIHSFAQFDLGIDQTAEFTGTLPTQSVITRVTGGSPSTLAGTLRASGSLANADFFLLNPAGLIVSGDLTLDIGGTSFLTTASNLGFDTGSLSGNFGTLPMNLSGTPTGFDFFQQSPLDLSGATGVTARGGLALVGPARLGDALVVQTSGDFLFLDVSSPEGSLGNVVEEASPDVQGVLSANNLTLGSAFSPPSLTSGVPLTIDTASGQAIGGDVSILSSVGNIAGSSISTSGAQSTGAVQISADPAVGMVLINGASIDLASLPVTLARVDAPAPSPTTPGTTVPAVDSDTLSPLQQSPTRSREEAQDPDADASGSPRSADEATREESASRTPPDVAAGGVSFSDASGALFQDLTGGERPDSFVAADFDPDHFGDPDYTIAGRLPLANVAAAAPEKTLAVGLANTQQRTSRGDTFLATDPLQYAPPFPKTCAARPDTQRRGSLTAQRFGLLPSLDGPLFAYEILIDPPANPETSGDSQSPYSEAVQRAMDATRAGKLDDALRHWTEAVRAASASDRDRAFARRGTAELQQALGHYKESMLTLRHAFEDAAGDPAAQALALGAIGDAQNALGRRDFAIQFLRRALENGGAGKRGLTSMLLNNLANQYSNGAGNGKEAAPSLVAATEVAATDTPLETKPPISLDLYLESARSARSAGRPKSELIALANAIRSATQQSDTELARELFERADSVADQVSPDVQLAKVELHLGVSARLLAITTRSPEDLLRARAAFRRALELAQQRGDPRVESHALGFEASLYQLESRTREALVLSRRATRAAERAQDPEALARWHRQQGQLLWTLGRADDAANALRRAVDILHEARIDSRDQLGRQGDFQSRIAPAYFELVNVLLAGTRLVADDADRESLLYEARDVIERLRTAEVRDYFRDQCIADVEASRRSIDERAGAAAVVYPIVLPDRIELLVHVPSRGLKRFSVPVSRAELRTHVDRFVTQIEGHAPDFQTEAQQLYDWLVAPYAPLLRELDVKTLVFVPDGPVRRIPLAALHDGNAFLIDRFELGVAPALSLLPSSPEAERGQRVLLAGISESVLGLSALPGVRRELAGLHEILGGGTLLDADFVLPRVQDRVAASDPVIVHMASHATFTGKPETTFIAMHDQRLTLDRLFDVVGMKRFQIDPLDLIVLSACQTAVGDDRAALGLAGVAVRAGARSALGSLWSVDDASTTQLMLEFYRLLQDGRHTKASALRAAQASLRAKSQWEHPYYWAPFMLINDWN